MEVFKALFQRVNQGSTEKTIEKRTVTRTRRQSPIPVSCDVSDNHQTLCPIIKSFESEIKNFQRDEFRHCYKGKKELCEKPLSMLLSRNIVRDI